MKEKKEEEVLLLRGLPTESSSELITIGHHFMRLTIEFEHVLQIPFSQSWYLQIRGLELERDGLSEHYAAHLCKTSCLFGKPHREGLYKEKEQVAAKGAWMGAKTRRRANPTVQWEIWIKDLWDAWGWATSLLQRGSILLYWYHVLLLRLASANSRWFMQGSPWQNCSQCLDLSRVSICLDSRTSTRHFRMSFRPGCHPIHATRNVAIFTLQSHAPSGSLWSFCNQGFEWSGHLAKWSWEPKIWGDFWAETSCLEDCICTLNHTVPGRSLSTIASAERDTECLAKDHHNRLQGDSTHLLLHSRRGWGQMLADQEGCQSPPGMHAITWLSRPLASSMTALLMVWPKIDKPI